MTPQTLEPAPGAGHTSPQAAPMKYRAEFLVETAEGYHVIIAGEELTPKNVMAWVRTASAELAKQGFKPVRRDIVMAAPEGPSKGRSASGAGAGYKGAVYEECPQCGGAVYDNREKKAGGEMKAHAPWFACRDRDGCGWAKWPGRGKSQ